MTYYGNLANNQGLSLEATHARAAASNANRRAEALESRVERLYMIAEALWSVLREQHGYTDDELLRRVIEIDMQDGRLDGRVAASGAPQCPHCGHTTSKHSVACIFCGKPVRVDLFAR